MFIIPNLVLLLLFFICFKCAHKIGSDSAAIIDTEGYLGDTEEEELDSDSSTDSFTIMTQTSKEKRRVDNKLKVMLAECYEYKRRLLSLVDVTERVNQTKGLQKWYMQSQSLSDNMKRFLIKPLPEGGTVSLKNLVITERDNLNHYRVHYLQKALEIPFPSSLANIP